MELLGSRRDISISIEMFCFVLYFKFKFDTICGASILWLELDRHGNHYSIYLIY